MREVSSWQKRRERPETSLDNSAAVGALTVDGVMKTDGILFGVRRQMSPPPKKALFCCDSLRILKLV
jgi:hypothetical protein